MMTRRIVWAAVLAFGLLGFESTRAEMITIWEAGFEDVPLNPANWDIEGDGIESISSSLALEGDGYLNVVGPSSEGGSSLSWTVETAGYQNLFFWGWYKVHGALEAGDLLQVQFRSDELSAWTDLALIEGPQPVNDWFALAGNLPDPTEDDPDVELRLWVHFNSGSDRVLADSFYVRGVVPEPATLALALLAVAFWATDRRSLFTRRGSLPFPLRQR